MSGRKSNVTEFREILLWQQLNRQVIRLKENGKTIKRTHQDYLQRFCLDNRLFSTIRQAPLAEGLPLALVTDLQRFSFITLLLRPWNRCSIDALRRLHRRSPLYTLDLDKAFADTYVAMERYNKKHRLFQGNKAEDDDEKLYDVIQRYLERVDKEESNFADMVTAAHRLKSAAVRRMMKIDGISFSLRDNRLVLRCKGTDGMADVAQIYGEFLKSAQKIVDPLTDTLVLYIQLLRDINAAPEFGDHEIHLLKRQEAVAKRFWRDSERLQRRKAIEELVLCDGAPRFSRRSSTRHIAISLSLFGLDLPPIGYNLARTRKILTPRIHYFS